MRSETGIWAADSGDEARLRAFLDAGGDIHFAYSIGLTALHIAARKRHAGIVRLLIARGADVNRESMDGLTPLHEALTAPSPRADDIGPARRDIVAQLIAAGARVYRDPDSVSRRGVLFFRQPLQLAVQTMDAALTRLLLDAGADVNGVDLHNWSALNNAVQCGSEDIVRELIARGVDVNRQTTRGVTALMQTAHFLAKPETQAVAAAIARRLLAAGARVDLADEDGSTALFYAINDINLPVLATLLDARADVHHRNAAGDTPLHYARFAARRSGDEAGVARCVRLLVARGADPRHVNRAGQTVAEDFAAAGLARLLDALTPGAAG
jgi:ankyrin repeat protein